MDWINQHLLTFIVFLPLVWGFLGLVIPTRDSNGVSLYRNWVLLGSLVTFVVSLALYGKFVPEGEEFQLLEYSSWIPAFGISYHLGIDGISLWLILLTTFLSPIVILGSYGGIQQRHKEYYFLMPWNARK